MTPAMLLRRLECDGLADRLEYLRHRYTAGAVELFDPMTLETVVSVPTTPGRPWAATVKDARVLFEVLRALRGLLERSIAADVELARVRKLARRAADLPDPPKKRGGRRGRPRKVTPS